jgi:glycosyltransferase involved in cell wall biosynthesis
MRIAQIAPIPERVPPKKYGGTERVIYHLTEELVRMGHDVTLFASGDSVTSAKLVSIVPKALREIPNQKDIYGFNVNSLLNLGLAYSRADQFDVIHDHNPHMGLPTANICRTPVIMTWHGPYDEEISRYFAMLNKPYLVSISDDQAARARGLNFIGTVYNGLPMENYPFSPTHQGYLLYVGRIDMEKGVHLAMDAAIKLNRKLILAAKLDAEVPVIKKYFEKFIKPRLRAHPDLLQWIGEVDEPTRNILMMNAMALLHAVTWPEPFGLSLIEAMACGCPVVAFNNGSIPEIVVNGETGFVVNNVDEMVDAVKNIDKIDRLHCREYSINTFSAKRMAQGYVDYYEKVIAYKKLKEEKLSHGTKRQKLFLGFGTAGNSNS